MKICAIILSKSASLKHYELTTNTLSSLLSTTSDLSIDTLIIENSSLTSLHTLVENVDEKNYFNISDNNKNKIMFKSEQFNFNRFLNYGIQYFKNKGNYDLFLFLNNDLIFEKDWLHNIIKAFNKDKELLSASPYTQNWHCHDRFKDSKQDVIIGMERSYEFCGWCFVVKKEFIDRIGKFNEGVEFFYSDDILVEQMQRNNIKHGLVRNSVITHLTSSSSDLLDCSVEQRLKKDREMFYNIKL